MPRAPLTSPQLDRSSDVDAVESGRFRDEVRQFISGLQPADSPPIGSLDDEDYRQFRTQLRAALAARGWIAPLFPTSFGGAGLGPAEQIVLVEELGTAGIPFGSDNDAFGIGMLGNTMLRYCSEDLLMRFLPRIVSGEYVFAQGFSEPNAGSDLAAVALRATLHDDQWVLNGQKLWSSGAHRANWMFVLARTNSAAPPHRGLTMLLVPLHQQGVTVRPIMNLTGDEDFNEVFFDAATTDADLVVGDIDDGWAVAMTLLGFERGETAMYLPIRFRNELDRLIDMVRARHLTEDSDIARRLAACYVRVEMLRCYGQRLIHQLASGRELGAEAAPFKLLWSEYHKVVTELGVDVLGLEALAPTGRRSPNWYQTDDPGAPNSSASWTSVYLNAFAGTIYGGSSQIQRSIVGELILGLPKEPKPAKSARQ